MKLKTITATVVLAATILAASSLAQQTRATSETSPAKAPAPAKPTVIGSALVYQLKDGHFVLEVRNDRPYYYLLDQSAVVQAVGEKGLEIKVASQKLDKAILDRCEYVSKDEHDLNARLNYWHLDANGKGVTTAHPINHEAARKLTLGDTSQTSCQDVLNANSSTAKTVQASAQVKKIEAQLSRSMKLPGKLLDAQFVQEQVGDGILGPSDFKAFYALKVPVSDIPAWEAALAATPVVNSSGTYAKPKQTQPWWVGEADFKTLKLHGPKNLTGWFNGWVGLSPDGRIFIYSFTM